MVAAASVCHERRRRRRLLSRARRPRASAARRRAHRASARQCRPRSGARGLARHPRSGRAHVSTSVAAPALCVSLPRTNAPSAGTPGRCSHAAAHACQARSTALCVARADLRSASASRPRPVSCARAATVAAAAAAAHLRGAREQLSRDTGPAELGHGNDVRERVVPASAPPPARLSPPVACPGHAAAARARPDRVCARDEDGGGERGGPSRAGRARVSALAAAPSSCVSPSRTDAPYARMPCGQACRACSMVLPGVRTDLRSARAAASRAISRPSYASTLRVRSAICGQLRGCLGP
jgi:hypothetical protein